MLDEHYNNVKALDALNQELFQLQMANKETSVRFRGCASCGASKSLSASFLERCPPDQVAELKQDHFYGGLPKQLKVMVAYIKATTNKKTYLDYLQAVQEAEKEEVMEISQNLAPASMTKLKATSFFPLQRAQEQSASCQSLCTGWHTSEEKSVDGEEGVDGEDPDCIKGVTEEFIICLARAVKYAQQTEKCCYHCDIPDHFIHTQLPMAGQNERQICL